MDLTMIIIIITELAEEFKKQFTCLGENTKKYITFTTVIEKEVTRIDKNGEQIIKNLSNILQFINIEFIDNLFFPIIFPKEFKAKHDNKKCETSRTKYKYCDCFLEYTNFKDDLIEYKCLCCNKN